MFSSTLYTNTIYILELVLFCQYYKINTSVIFKLKFPDLVTLFINIINNIFLIERFLDNDLRHVSLPMDLFCLPFQTYTMYRIINHKIMRISGYYSCQGRNLLGEVNAILFSSYIIFNIEGNFY